MSEIPGVLNNPFHGDRTIGSMGKPSRHPDPAIAFAEMKVVDDDGNEVADGETGELVVRTPIVMQGYYRDPEQTAAAFRDGWFLTGDLGRRDADGYFWFVARKKDIIRKRGENISGAELDRVISSHPDVLEAAAIPVPVGARRGRDPRRRRRAARARDRPRRRSPTGAASGSRRSRCRATSRSSTRCRTRRRIASRSSRCATIATLRARAVDLQSSG